MSFQSLRSFLNILRHEPESLDTFEGFNRLRQVCPGPSTRAEVFHIFADILEEHIFCAWDYEIPHKCQQEVDDRSVPEGASDCGEPAPYRTQWLGDGEMWVCEEHFQAMQKSETEYRERVKTVVL